jgi:hypothetical protein
MFRVYIPNVSSVQDECCKWFCLDVAKSRSRCCMYMHVASICFKCFQVFHTYVCKSFIWMLHMFAMVFKCFSCVFASVSDTYFTCFIYLLLYVATVASGCFKSRSSIAHGMRLGSGQQRGWHSGRHETTTGALPHEHARCLFAPQRLDAGASKSTFCSPLCPTLMCIWHIFSRNSTFELYV